MWRVRVRAKVFTLPCIRFGVHCGEFRVAVYASGIKVMLVGGGVKLKEHPLMQVPRFDIPSTTNGSLTF